MKFLRWLLAWFLALLVTMWRLTCRYRLHNDPRPTLRQNGKNYVYAMLHAHQVAKVFLANEKQLGLMVSRSADGDLLVPTLLCKGVTIARGSTRSKGRDKGGRAALDKLIEHVKNGKPGLLAVDGPKGPRNYVHRGIVDLSLATGAAILPLVLVPTRRLILSGTWDRMQIPAPFSRIDVYYGDVVGMDGGDPEALREQISVALQNLETAHDPGEALYSKKAANGSLGPNNERPFPS